MKKDFAVISVWSAFASGSFAAETAEVVRRSAASVGPTPEFALALTALALIAVYVRRRRSIQ